MSTDAPFSGGLSNSPSDDDQPYSWINEWLCEYVDGTMDPALEAVFTSYVEANPELKAHIEDLQHTRNLLNQCCLPEDTTASRRAQTNACAHTESDLLHSKLSLQEVLSQRPQFAAGMVASVVTALIVGMFVGATIVETPTLRTEEAETELIEPRADSRLPASTALSAPSIQRERLAPRAARPAVGVSAAEVAGSWVAPALARDSLGFTKETLGLVRTSR